MEPIEEQHKALPEKLENPKSQHFEKKELGQTHKSENNPLEHQQQPDIEGMSVFDTSKLKLKRYRHKKRYNHDSQNQNDEQQSVQSNELQQLYHQNLNRLQEPEPKYDKLTISLAQPDGEPTDYQKMVKLKSQCQVFFENVLVQGIIQSNSITESKKFEVIDIYKGMNVFSPSNSLFYKRLIKHQHAYPKWQLQDPKNLINEPDEQLPRIRQLLRGHLIVGAGIQNIRTYYKNQDMVKDQYATLLHAILRVIFSKIRDYIVGKYPRLNYLLHTTKAGTARFNYSNAVSLVLLHAQNEFSMGMLKIYEKIAKVVFYLDGIQAITLNEVLAMFEFLRQRNQQHLIPLRFEETKPKAKTGSRKAMWENYMVFVPYNEPYYDVDLETALRPQEDEIFEKCLNYTTKIWTLKFQKYVLALYLKYQNFFDVKDQLSKEYYAHWVGRELDLDELRIKFQMAMKKVLMYLQLDLAYIIRRTNFNKNQAYKVDFPTKKFLTLNKNEKRALFASENSKNCRLFFIDYYLNNCLRPGKSYKMSLINYRLGYLMMVVEASLMFLQTKTGECGILVQSDLEKQDTYPMKLITNGYFKIVKSILREVILHKSYQNDDRKEKMVKNPNTKRGYYNPVQVDKLFEELRPDDLMEIQLMYTLKRNLSLIIKRNPQKFPDVKLNKTLQEGLVDEEWDKIEEIIERRGANLLEDQEDDEETLEKFQTTEGINFEDEDALHINQLKRTGSSQGGEGANGRKQPNANERKRKGNHEVDEEQLKKDREEFMKAVRDSEFVKMEMLILKVNSENNYFKKYYK